MRSRTSFTGTASGEPVSGNGESSLVWVVDDAGTATIVLEISFDGGTNYDTYATYTNAVGSGNIPGFPGGAMARLRCSAYTSGTIIGGIACGKRG